MKISAGKGLVTINMDKAHCFVHFLQDVLLHKQKQEQHQELIVRLLNFCTNAEHCTTVCHANPECSGSASALVYLQSSATISSYLGMTGSENYVVLKIEVSKKIKERFVALRYPQTEL